MGNILKACIKVAFTLLTSVSAQAAQFPPTQKPAELRYMPNADVAAICEIESLRVVKLVTSLPDSDPSKKTEVSGRALIHWTWHLIAGEVGQPRDIESLRIASLRETMDDAAPIVNYCSHAAESDFENRRKQMGAQAWTEAMARDLISIEQAVAREKANGTFNKSPYLTLERATPTPINSASQATTASQKETLDAPPSSSIKLICLGDGTKRLLVDPATKRFSTDAASIGEKCVLITADDTYLRGNCNVLKMTSKYEIDRSTGAMIEQRIVTDSTYSKFIRWQCSADTKQF